MKKRTWLFSGLGFLIFGGLALSACSVVPNPNLNPDFDVIDDTEQDYFVNKLFDTKYLRATLDVNVTYKHDDEEKPLDKYHVTGNATFDLNSLDDIAADVSLSLDMNDADVVAKKLFPEINLDFTYFNSTVYVDINNRSVKLETDKFSELLDLVLGDGSGDDSSSSSGDTTNIAGLLMKDEGEGIFETAKHYLDFIEWPYEADDLKATCKTLYNVVTEIGFSDVMSVISALPNIQRALYFHWHESTFVLVRALEYTPVEE